MILTDQCNKSSIKLTTALNFVCGACVIYVQKGGEERERERETHKTRPALRDAAFPLPSANETRKAEQTRGIVFGYALVVVPRKVLEHVGRFFRRVSEVTANGHTASTSAARLDRFGNARKKLENPPS